MGRAWPLPLPSGYAPAGIAYIGARWKSISVVVWRLELARRWSDGDGAKVRFGTFVLSLFQDDSVRSGSERTLTAADRKEF